MCIGFFLLHMHGFDRNLHFLLHREREDEFTSLANLTGEGNVLAVRFDDLFCDSKSETGSGLILSAARIRLIETVENFLDRFRWNSHTLILDTDIDFIRFFRDLNRDLATLRGEFDRIINQIIDNLLDSCSIGIDNGIVGMEDRVQINAFVLTTAFKGVDRRKNDALDIKIRFIKLKVKGIKVVKFQKPLCQFGKTHSFAQMMAGFHKCSGDIVVCLDDDGQTPADEVGKLLAKIDEGYDVVYASYDTKRQAGWRNLGSWVNSKMTEIMLGKPPELVVNSYFAARRFVVEEMLRYEHCYPYVIGLVLRSTKHICNVPVHHRAREEGSSGYTLRKLLNLWMNGFTSFSVKPLRIATYFGTLFAAAGFVYLIYIVIDHFTRGAAPMGWASTTALLLLLGGMILVVLGIMGEYVGRIYMCANAAPQYVEREVIRHEGDNA